MSWDWSLFLARRPHPADIERIDKAGAFDTGVPHRVEPYRELPDVLAPAAVRATLNLWEADWDKAYEDLGIPPGTVMSRTVGDRTEWRTPDGTVLVREIDWGRFAPGRPWAVRRSTPMWVVERIVLGEWLGGETARRLARTLGEDGPVCLVLAREDAERLGLLEGPVHVGAGELLVLEGDC